MITEHQPIRKKGQEQNDRKEIQANAEQLIRTQHESASDS
jgi:hypothetical protein